MKGKQHLTQISEDTFIHPSEERNKSKHSNVLLLLPFSKFPSTYTSRKDFEGNGVSLTMPSEGPERNSHHIRRKKDGKERRKFKGKYSKKKTALPEG